MGAAASSEPPAAAQPEPERVSVFETRPGGSVFRIPALLHLRAQRLFLAFAEKRSSPADSDAEVLVMRRGTLGEDGGVQWSPCEELSTAQLPDHRTMNPCPVLERKSGAVFLFFICVACDVTECHQIVTGRNRARLCCVRSPDGGLTWSEPTDLTESAIGGRVKKWATFGVGPGHGVQLEGGRLVVPAYAYYAPYRCCSFPVPYTVRPRALCVYSDDLGHTWRLGQMLRKTSCECEVAEIVDAEGRSHLYCNARTSRGHRCQALSRNSGVDFDRPSVALELVETPSGCQGSVVGFPAPAGAAAPPDEAPPPAPLRTDEAQTWLLFTHPTDRRSRRDLGAYLNRSPLRPGGWERPRVLHRGPSGYSDLAHDPDTGRFACLAECGVRSELEQIAFMTFTLDQVTRTARPQEDEGEATPSTN